VTYPRVHSVLVLILGVLVLAASGCANNSTITHSYIDPTVNKLNLSGVMVVAVTKKMESRIDYEDAFAKVLRAKGVNAVASHTLLPQVKPTKDEVIEAASGAQLDTVLVTRYLGAQNQEVFHPGTIYYGVAPAYGYGGYYGRAYEVAYEQPVWSTNVTYTLTSDLFASGQGQLHLWQAVSETIKAGGSKKLRDDTIKSFVGNMKDAGLFH
jgi:hypothetical protein